MRGRDARSSEVIAERGLRDRRRRHPQDDRQRHPVHRPELRLPDGVQPGRPTSIRAAHVEAQAAPNGVGLVRLMGRHSGFIACYAALANSDADFVLIPEVPFALDGEHGLAGRTCAQRVAERGQRGGRGRRGGRSGRSLRARAAPGPTPRATRSCATSAVYLRAADHRALRRGRRRDSTRIHRPQLRHPQRAGRTPTTACTACGCRRPRCTPRWRAAPRWWSGRWHGGSCTCRWRWP